MRAFRKDTVLEGDVADLGGTLHRVPFSSKWTPVTPAGLSTALVMTCVARSGVVRHRRFQQMLWFVSRRTTILVASVKSLTGGGLPKPAVIRGRAGGAAGFFILFAAAVAASTIACGLVRQSIPTQVRSPGL